MSTTDWMTIRVVLLGREGEALQRPPGRIMLASADHTFADLSEAIDVAFGRWDLTPLHEFEVDGRRLTAPEDAEESPGAASTDRVRLRDAGLQTGDVFRYVFDLGDRWLHNCLVEENAVEPGQGLGEAADVPYPIFGWGTIPDQYGREAEDEDEDEEAGLEDWAADDDLDAEPVWDDEDEAAFLAAWDEARGAAWAVVQAALDDVERPLDRAELHRVTTALRQHRTEDRHPFDVLWTAADLDELPDDDEALWTVLGAAVIEPRGELPVELEVEAAWASLEPADWAGAVIELTRAGPGRRAEPEDLVTLIAQCPEIEGPPLGDDDVATLELAFGPVVELWRVLGVLDDEHRLTPLGRWGLVEALRVAWTMPA